MLSVVETTSMNHPGSFLCPFCFWANPDNSRFHSTLLIPVSSVCKLLAQLHNYKCMMRLSIVHTYLNAGGTRHSTENKTAAHKPVGPTEATIVAFSILKGTLCL